MGGSCFITSSKGPKPWIGMGPIQSIAQKVCIRTLPCVTLRSNCKVLLLVNVGRDLARWVCYRRSLLDHIRGRMSKLGVFIVKSLLDVCSKLGGEWAWPSGYGSRSFFPLFEPLCTVQMLRFASQFLCEARASEIPN